MPLACTDNFDNEFFTTVTERCGPQYLRSTFSVIQRHKASGGTWTFHHCDTYSQDFKKKLDLVTLVLSNWEENRNCVLLSGVEVVDDSVAVIETLLTAVSETDIADP